MQEEFLNILHKILVSKLPFYVSATHIHASNENFLTESCPLLWLLDPIASCSMTFALHLAIALESTDFNTTQTWVAIF